METTVEILEGNQKKVTVTVDAKEVDNRIRKQYKDFAYQYNFPGFRKGKAPRPVIDNTLGKQAVVATVTDDIVNGLYPLAMDELDLIAMGQPEIETSTDLVQAGQPFSFTAVVDTRPELDLDNFEPVSIKLPAATATEAEIDSQIDELRQYYFDFKDSPANTKVKEDSFVDLAMTATNAEGEAIDSLATESRLYELGRGLFPEAFDEALLGMKKGDTKSIEIDMTTEPSTIGSGLPDAGVITFEFTVNQVKKKILPELNDEWAKNTAGFESLQAMRDMIAQNINMQKSSMLPRLRENEALYALQERLQGEVPEVLCEAEEQNLIQNFFMQMQQSGMTFDAYLAQAGLTPETFKDDIKKQAADVVAQDLALDAWARNADIQISDEDISAEFERSGAEDPKALEKQWRENGQMAMLRAGMRRQRALEQILDSLIVEELEAGEEAAQEASEEATEAAVAEVEPEAAAQEAAAEDAQ
ncbi:MAG: trigger factor [Eggerthellaceae bacterium]|nr:trigger factor [Eggerthellaceae bacterium]